MNDEDGKSLQPTFFCRFRSTNNVIVINKLNENNNNNRTKTIYRVFDIVQQDIQNVSNYQQ